MGSKATPTSLPTIDFSEESLKPGTNTWLSACEVIRNALEEYGCFVAMYDRVSFQLHNDMFDACQELFELPTDIKVKNTSQVPLFGYLAQRPDVSMYESFGIGRATNPTAVEHFSNIMWPSGNNHFREITNSYAILVSELEQTVTKMVFASYGAEKHYASHVESCTYTLRFNKYRVPGPGETNCGAEAHTDKSFFSIIYQNHVSGLEVQTKAGEWISVQFPPSSFVVMAADASVAWSNGRIHSSIHRVVMYEKVARYSLLLMTFHNGTISTPEELIDEEHPAQFKPFNHLELLRFFANNRLQKGCIAKTYCGV